MSELVVTTSWDDGSVSDLELAELLEKYGFSGTFYIPKAHLDNPLQQKDIAAMDRKFEIGAHTLTHTDSTAISLAEARKEIVGATAPKSSLPS